MDGLEAAAAAEEIRGLYEGTAERAAEPAGWMGSLKAEKTKLEIRNPKIGKTEKRKATEKSRSLVVPKFRDSSG